MNALDTFSKSIFVIILSLLAGGIIALCPEIGVVVAVLVFVASIALHVKHLWAFGIWIPLFGLGIWSYGFNNVPLIRPLPLVDALIGFAIIFSSRYWWPLRRNPVVGRLLVLLSLLAIVIFYRLVLDIPRFGILAPRDALFAFELWGIFPSIALGMLIGERKVEQSLSWLFTLVTIWFLFYPWHEFIESISPVVGIQHPVPLFSHNASAGALIVIPSFFWFTQKGGKGVLGAASALLILFFIQSRGPYIAFTLSLLILSFIYPAMFKKWWKIGAVGVIVMLILLLAGKELTGRLGVPVSIDTVGEQLQTLLGKEGPGAGSFHQRLIAWPMVIQQVMSEHLGPIIGVGLGVDLFQGFTVGPGILVRKPHNDFLEIWARLGISGLLPWLGFLFVLFQAVLKNARSNLKHSWVLALQITLIIISMGQPAMGFAYITIVWTTLTGLWLGTRLRKSGNVPGGV